MEAAEVDFGCAHSRTPSDATVYLHAGIYLDLDDLSLARRPALRGWRLWRCKASRGRPDSNVCNLSDATDNNVTIRAARHGGPPLLTCESVTQTGATLAGPTSRSATTRAANSSLSADTDVRASGYYSATKVACAPTWVEPCLTRRPAQASAD